MSGWNQDSNLAAHLGQQRMADVRVEHSTTPTTNQRLDEPATEFGRFRRWWSDHPMLSVVVMFVAPVVALLLFMALY